MRTKHFYIELPLSHSYIFLNFLPPFWKIIYHHIVHNNFPGFFQWSSLFFDSPLERSFTFSFPSITLLLYANRGNRRVFLFLPPPPARTWTFLFVSPVRRTLPNGLNLMLCVPFFLRDFAFFPFWSLPRSCYGPIFFIVATRSWRTIFSWLPFFLLSVPPPFPPLQDFFGLVFT